MKLPLTLLSSVLLLAGCRHSRPHAAALAPSPLSEPVGVRLPERLHTYQVGRGIDPASGDLLHEAHPVYRLEQEARWDLRPGTSPGLGSEPWRDPAVAVLPVSDEVMAELRRQQTVTRAVMRQAEQLAAALASLDSLFATARATALAQEQLRQELARLQQQLGDSGKLNASVPSNLLPPEPAVSDGNEAGHPRPSTPSNPHPGDAFHE